MIPIDFPTPQPTDAEHPFRPVSLIPVDSSLQHVDPEHPATPVSMIPIDFPPPRSSLVIILENRAIHQVHSLPNSKIVLLRKSDDHRMDAQLQNEFLTTILSPCARYLLLQHRNKANIKDDEVHVIILHI